MITLHPAVFHTGHILGLLKKVLAQRKQKNSP
jgi:hypothetical protein